MESTLTRPSSSPPPSRIPRRRLPRLEAFGLSHTGLVRATNEDAYAVAPNLGFFAVADGVGGNAAGEVASQMAIETVHGMMKDLAALSPQAELNASVLAHAVLEANACVRAGASADVAREGMSTTFTGLLVFGERAIIAHVGDSRAYHLRGRQLRLLTDDHTLVNICLQGGILTREQAATSDLRHIIARAVGLEETLHVDTRLVGIEPGDTFLLASDGLHGVLADDDIAAVLLGERDLTRAAARLVERANDAGGPDNVTVVLVRVG
jgi:serine/threonine protein phosphatase PrpC